MKTSEAMLRAAREWKARNPERNAEGKRRWAKDNPEKIREACRRWKLAHHEKHMAQKALWKAVKRGKIVRPDRCERCGAADDVQGHHDDYAKRLEARWLCNSCHKLLHRFF